MVLFFLVYSHSTKCSNAHYLFRECSLRGYVLVSVENNDISINFTKISKHKLNLVWIAKLSFAQNDVLSRMRLSSREKYDFMYYNSMI